MLTYTMDVEPRSTWLRTTPGDFARTLPFCVTEAGEFFANSRFATSRSHKASHLLFYTVSGEGWLRQEGQEIRLPEGAALFLDCREPQSYGTLGEAGHWHHLWIHVSGSGADALSALLIPEGKPQRVFLPDSAKELFTQVFSELPKETSQSQVLAGEAVHRLLARMIASGARSQTKAGDENRRLIEESAAYIRASCAEPLSIPDLLARTHMSKSYYLRLFRQYMGTTPYNYLLRCRVTRAKELLELTDLPLAVIAEQTGFCDESNFSTRFSRIAGASPAQYRRNAITYKAGS